MKTKFYEKKAFDTSGNEVAIGSTIQSFRGEKAILTGLTRAGTIYRSGLVCVEWLDEQGNVKGSGEYYDRVFGLKVIELEEEIPLNKLKL